MKINNFRRYPVDLFDSAKSVSEILDTVKDCEMSIDHHARQQTSSRYSFIRRSPQMQMNREYSHWRNIRST